MAVSQISDAIGAVREQWMGMPKSLFPRDGTFYMMTKKGGLEVWTGARDGSPEVNYGYEPHQVAAGSASLDTAWNNPQNNNIYRIGVDNPGKWWQVPHINWQALLLLRNQPFNFKQHLTARHPARFNTIMSFLAWQNGGGAIARLNGDGSALTGTTLSIKNSQCMKLFTIGDRIQFSDTDGTTGTLRAYIGTVTAIDKVTAELTVTPAIVGGDNVVDNDYVFFANSHHANSSDTPMFKGLSAWNPITYAKAVTSLYGMTRSTDVTAFSGWREVINPTDDPWNVLLLMLRRASEQSLDIKDIFVTKPVLSRLLESGRNVHLRLSSLNGQGGYNMSVRPLGYRRGADGNAVPVTNWRNMAYGVEGIEIMWPEYGQRVRVFCDNYMINIDSTAEDDITYRALDVDEWEMIVHEGGPNWFSTDENGPWYWLQGTEKIGAVFGAYGQFRHKRPGNTMVFSPNATTS